MTLLTGLKTDLQFVGLKPLTVHYRQILPGWKNGQTTIFIRNLLRLCSSFQFRNASPVLAIALGYLTQKQPYKSF